MKNVEKKEGAAEETLINEAIVHRIGVEEKSWWQNDPSFFPSFHRARMINDIPTAFIAHEFSRSQSCTGRHIRMLGYVYASKYTLCKCIWNWRNLADE